MTSFRLYLIGSISLLSGCISAQSDYFQGKIITQTQFEIKDSTKRALYFSTTNPDQTINYYKEGNSFVIFDKGSFKTYLYLKSENKAYINEWNDDTLNAFDCGREGRKIFKYSIQESTDTILGFPCSKLILEFDGSSSTYYFNKDALKINPAWYEKQTYVNWDFISKTLGCMPLRTVIERSDYKTTTTVTSFSKEIVSDKYFTIPTNVTVVEEK